MPPSRSCTGWVSCTRRHGSCRARRRWPRLVHVIDAAVQKAITGDASTEAILREAQAQTAGMRL